MFISLGRKLRDDSGIALVWVSVLIMVLGLFVAGVLSLARPMDNEKKQQITLQNMDGIIYALAVYLQKNGRMPCPADPDVSETAQPFGTERGSGSTGENAGSCSAAGNRYGIVPFKTLGLPERNIRDGWRNFITYRTVGITSGAKVHDLCRVYTNPGHGGPLDSDWAHPPGPPPNNKNITKAYFCCGAVESGFDVVDSGNDSIVYPGGSPPASNGPNYGPITSVAPSHTIAAGATIPDKLAVVLVSHGSNGMGAFLEDGSKVSTVGAIASERENADGDGLFVMLPKNLADTAYFDDIIVWRTQSQLLSELGSGVGNAIDCSSPFP